MKRNRSDVKNYRTPSGAAVKRPALTAALVRSLFEEWARVGYAALSLERVAARAGAGKAAIYRRWSSKRDFVEDAVGSLAVKITPFGDAGSLEADIAVFLRSLRRVLRHPLASRILPDLFAECARSDDLSAMLERISTERRKMGCEILSRAVLRGELPTDLDYELALDLLPSALYWRMISTRRPATNKDLMCQARVLATALKSARLTA